MSRVFKKPRKIADSPEQHPAVGLGGLSDALKKANQFNADCYNIRSARGRKAEAQLISDSYREVFDDYPEPDLLPGLSETRVYYKLANDGFQETGLSPTLVSKKFQQNMKAALQFQNSYRGFSPDFVETLRLLGEAEQETKGDETMAKTKKAPTKVKAAPKPVKKTATEKKPRQNILGHTITGVLRWLGANGFNSKQAEAVLKHYKVTIAPSTLVTEVCAGRVQKHGDPAPLTRNQQAEIKKHIPAAEKPKPKPKKAAPKKVAPKKKAPVKKTAPKKKPKKIK